MKVQIKVLCKHNDKLYYGVSNIIEWNLPMPIKGDAIEILDTEPFFKMDFNDLESEEMILGDAFEYVYKNYTFIDGVPIIVFYFGDWDSSY